MKPAAPATDTPEVRAQLEVFERGVVDLIERRELAERIARSLATNKPLRIKFGMDPSSPDLHVGHCVPLFKLRDLQQLGHQIVLIVGDATAMVGDPSGRNKLRPQLTRAEVEIEPRDLRHAGRQGARLSTAPRCGATPSGSTPCASRTSCA